MIKVKIKLIFIIKINHLKKMIKIIEKVGLNKILLKI
jgi:hypothetical protein